MANEENTNVEELKLDDARRVKVLTPGMLVAKRFSGTALRSSVW